MRKYVDVNADFTKDGIIIPREIVWQDGKHYAVDRVSDIERLTRKSGDKSDRYTIIIGTQKRYLYLETSGDLDTNNVGRWYVEQGTDSKGATESILRPRCCCFTGHRPEKLDLSEEEIKEALQEEIHSAIEQGYTTFIAGMACGVDLWAGEIILGLKEKGAPIRLDAAIPFDGFQSQWNEGWKERYKSVLFAADGIHYICERYSGYCYQMRNEWMVDHSSLVIAAYNGHASGTKNTVVYAKNCGVEVHNILT